MPRRPARPTRPRRVRAAARLALWAAVTAGFAPIAIAQTDEPEAAPVAPGLADDGLDTLPLSLEALGITIRLPLVSNNVTERSGGRVSLSVSDASSPPRWNMRIQAMSSTLSEPSPAAQIEQHLNGLRALDPDFRLIANGPATFGDLSGQLCYIMRELPEQGQLVFGWFIVPRGDPEGRQFMVFSLVAEASAFPAIRGLVESSLATIGLRAGAEVSLERRARLEQGRALLASISPERLRELVGITSWMRIYRPADDERGTPEREIGYSSVSIESARRSAVGGTDGSDHDPEGLLVRVQGRVLVEEAYLDSIAQYWMAWDQSSEAWDVRATERLRGEPLQTVAETGIRLETSVGSPRPTLTVIQSTDTTRTREPFQWDVPESYLPQALGWVLGRVLPRNAVEPTVYSYYYYFPGREPRMSLRSDHWAPAEDGSGTWTLSTRLGADVAPFVTTYAADGSLLRRLRSDRSVTVPITLEELRRLWQRKGLKLDSKSR